MRFNANTTDHYLLYSALCLAYHIAVDIMHFFMHESYHVILNMYIATSHKTSMAHCFKIHTAHIQSLISSTQNEN